MTDYLKKTFNLIYLLPSHFYLSFLLYFFLALLVIFFELLAVSFLMPLLTMLSNNDFDPSQFSNFVNKFNTLFLEITTFNILQNILNLGIAIFVIFLIKVFIQFISVWVAAKIALNAQLFYSLKLYKSYLNKEYFFHLKNGPAKLFRNTMVEVNNFTSSILFQSLTLFVELCVLIAIFIFAFIVEPKIMFVVLSMFSIVLILFFLTKQVVKKQGEIRVDNDEKRISDVQNSFEAIKDIIINNISSIFYDSFETKSKIVNVANFLVRIFSALPRLLLELCAVLVLLISIFFFTDPSESGGLERIGLFLIVAFRSLPGIAKLASVIQTFVFLKPSLDILNFEFFKNLKTNQLNSKKGKNKIILKKEIQFSNVNFVFEKKDPLLKNLNLKIQKGSRVGIIGESGYGKSTMIHLLLGLLEPSRGEIKIDGVTLEKKNKINWRENIGYVGQKIALINGGVKDNIILGKKYDSKKFNKIVKACELENFVKKRMNDINLKSNISAKVSGGEAQRLGIARALYQEPQILVMDESTNALDKNNEKKILNFIYSIKSITIFFIAHNTSSLFGCDKIINFYSKGRAKLDRNYLIKK